MEKHKLNIPKQLFVEEVRRLINAGHTARFRVRGWSMRIFVEHERDEVLLAPCHAEQLKRGDVVLALTTEGEYVLHRIVRVDGQMLTLQGDGNVGIIERTYRKDVVGIAQGFYRKGRTELDSVSGWKWRTYSSIWLFFKPFRRYLLTFYRLFH